MRTSQLTRNKNFISGLAVIITGILGVFVIFGETTFMQSLVQYPHDVILTWQWDSQVGIVTTLMTMLGLFTTCAVSVLTLFLGARYSIKYSAIGIYKIGHTINKLKDRK